MIIGVGLGLPFRRAAGVIIPPDLILDGIVAHYGFDDGSGQVLSDTSGNDLHGRLGSTTGSDTNDPVWISQGLDFDGTDDYVHIGDPAALRFTTAMTIEVVYYIFNNSNPNVLVAKWSDGDVTNQRSYWLNQRLAFSVSSNGTNPGSVTVSGINVDNPQWYYATALYTGTKLQTYMRGDLANEVNYSDGIHAGTYPVRFGRRSEANPFPFNGMMAYVIMRNIALNADQIKQNYKALRAMLKPRGINL